MYPFYPHLSASAPNPPDNLDPPNFVPYSQASGLPLESKLVTYLTHTPATSPGSLTQAMGNLNLGPSPQPDKNVMVNDYGPVNYHYQAPPLVIEPPENPPHLPLHQEFRQENVGGTTYYFSKEAELAALNAQNMIADPCLGGSLMGPGPMAPGPYIQPMYANIPPPIGPLKSGLAGMYYTAETIQIEMCERNEDLYKQPSPNLYPEIPAIIDHFSDVMPLDMRSLPSRLVTFRAAHRETSRIYALRRLSTYSIYSPARLEKWKQLDHPNIVKLEDYYHSNTFTDQLMLVYEYVPRATSMLEKFLTGGVLGPAQPDAGNTYHDPFSSDPNAPRPYTHQKNVILRAAASGSLLPEPVIWSILIQLTAALRAIHGTGLAYRCLDPTKIIVSGCRVRLAWCGAFDATANDVIQAQQDDLSALGRIALCLACRTVNCDNFAASLDVIGKSYSPDFKNLILYLLTMTPVRRSVNDLMPIIGARFYSQMEALERRNSVFEEQYSSELDNGRLLRLLIKLGAINERPELNLDMSWSETGDRYMLKLFRDYLFHTVNEHGRPCLDQVHVAHCLNQLDAGAFTMVELMTRDMQSILVVSYAELKHCLEQTYEEIMQASVPPP